MNHAAHPIPLAMIGGGGDAFIGDVHRRAAALDGCFKLVAGVFSRDHQRSLEAAHSWNVDGQRCYPTLEAMLESEAQRPSEDRVRAVAIVTPNHTHHPIARACLQAGLHVVLEKPMTISTQEAAEIRSLAEANNLSCALMYTYSGYPMVREARARVLAGELGTIRRIYAEYHQGWLSTKAEQSVPQAIWRTDPALAGPGGALGDIGTHAHHLTGFITGLEIASLCAETTSFVEGRQLDDDAAVMLRFHGGARGLLSASQICAGEANALSIRIYGDRGGLRWRQQQPETLELLRLDGAVHTLTRGMDGLSPAAVASSRIPPGHPEGYIEAFANIYRGAAHDITARAASGKPNASTELLPGPAEGHAGVRFVELCVQSAREGGVWVDWR